MSQHPDSTRLERYAAGRLSPAEASAVGDHLDTCDTCAEAVAAASALLADLAEGGPTDPGPQFWAALSADIEAATVGAPRPGATVGFEASGASAARFARRPVTAPSAGHTAPPAARWGLRLGAALALLLVVVLRLGPSIEKDLAEVAATPPHAGSVGELAALGDVDAETGDLLDEDTDPAMVALAALPSEQVARLAAGLPDVVAEAPTTDEELVPDTTLDDLDDADLSRLVATLDKALKG